VARITPKDKGLASRDRDLGLQELIQLRRGEGCIGTKVAPQHSVFVSADDRLQQLAPAIEHAMTEPPRYRRNLLILIAESTLKVSGFAIYLGDPG
jgi:hypothetical protein